MQCYTLQSDTVRYPHYSSPDWRSFAFISIHCCFSNDSLFCIINSIILRILKKGFVVCISYLFLLDSFIIDYIFIAQAMHFPNA